MAKKNPIAKPLIWLIISLSLILSTSIFLYSAIFPVGNSMFAATTMFLYLLFAGGFLLLFMRYRKVKRNMLYLFLVVAMIFAPVAFSVYFMMVAVFSAVIGLLYLLMHFVFAGGFLILYVRRGEIKKLI